MIMHMKAEKKKSGRKPYQATDVVIVLHRKSKKDPISGCRIWLGYKDKDGYGTIGFQGGVYRVHRLIYRFLVGEIPPGLVVRHSCDNSSCVEIDHLLLGTAQDNDADRVERNRQAKGERHGMAKLTEGQVREIKELLKTGLPALEIAKRYGVKSRHCIYAISNGETWRHLTNG